MIDKYSKLYNYTPQIIKNSMLSIYYLLTYRQRYFGKYNYYLKLINQSKTWDRQTFRSYQNSKLKLFLTFAYANTKYYNKLFNQINFNPNLFKDQEELKLIPTLDKDIISKNYNDIIPHKWLKKNKFITIKTSGTTGSPLQFPRTFSSEQFNYAKYDFTWENFLGKKYGYAKIAFIAGHKVKNSNDNNPPFWAYNLLTKTIYFSSYHLSYHNMKYYIQKLIKFQPEAIAGYPSSLSLIATYIIENNITLQIPNIWLCSETYFEKDKIKIIQAFSPQKVNNNYGCAEGIGPSVYHNNKSYLLQIDNLVDLSNNKTRFTQFENYAFPLINYLIEDEIELVNNIDDSYFMGPRIKSIYGRNEDYIITHDNRKIGRLDHIFKDAQNIIEAQIVQDFKGSAIFKIVVNDKFTSIDKNKIIDEIKIRLGNDFKYNILTVNKIERLTNGKFKFVINKMNLKGY